MYSEMAYFDTKKSSGSGCRSFCYERHQKLSYSRLLSARRPLFVDFRNGYIITRLINALTGISA